MRFHHLIPIAALACCGLASRTFAAATPLSHLRYTPDVTVVLGGVTITDNDVATDNLTGGVALVNVGSIPGQAQITAYDRLASGDQLLAFDTTIALAGGLTVKPGDIVRYDGTTYTLLFDAAANGVPSGVVTDAVSAIGPNDLLLSFDITVAVGGITASDRDVVRFHNGVFSLFVDGNAQGVGAGLDLDALHCIPSNGHLLMSFDGSGVVGGVAFDDEDILEFNPNTGAWARAYDGSAEHAGWSAADLQTVEATTAPPETVMKPVIKNGLQLSLDNPPPGGWPIQGMGTARAKPGDTCIEIYEVGADGTPDTPPGSGDDVLVGVGGTDADGQFVDPSDAVGIAQNTPLHKGQRIYAADVCSGEVGPITLIGNVPAPALGLAGTMLLGVALTLVGLRRLRMAAQ